MIMIKRYMGYMGDIIRTIILKIRYIKAIKCNGIQHIRKRCTFDIRDGKCI